MAKEETFRPRVLAHYTGEQLSQIADRFLEAKKGPGENTGAILERIEPDVAKRRDLEIGINVLIGLKDLGLKLEEVRSVVVWSTQSLGKTRLAITGTRLRT